nr:hypothetical protein [Actinomadura geliboluensis]
MASDEHRAAGEAAGTASPDAGLLSPVRAGTQAEAATSDLAYLAAMLDAEAALARAQARLGIVPTDAAETIAAAAVPDRDHRARGAGGQLQRHRDADRVAGRADHDQFGAGGAAQQRLQGRAAPQPLADGARHAQLVGPAHAAVEQVLPRPLHDRLDLGVGVAGRVGPVPAVAHQQPDAAEPGLLDRPAQGRVVLRRPVVSEQDVRPVLPLLAVHACLPPASLRAARRRQKRTKVPRPRFLGAGGYFARR